MEAKIMYEEQKKSPISNIFMMLVLALSTGAVLPLWRAQSQVTADLAQGDVLIQALWMLVYFLIIFIVLFGANRILYIKDFNLLILWLLVGMAVFSALWADNALISLRQSGALVGTTLLGMFIARRFSEQKIFKLASYTLGLLAILSIIVAVVAPSYGIHEWGLHSGSWRGVFIHKNNLGKMMALSAIFWYLFKTYYPAYKPIGWFFIGLSVVLVVLSKSAGAAVALTTVFLFLPTVSAIRKKNPFIQFMSLILLVGTSVLLMLVAGNYEGFLEILGRDATLTGRSALWYLVWQQISEKYLLGFGYGGFWLGYNGPSASIWNLLPWTPVDAHNGFLDQWLQLGIIGLSIFAVSLIINLKRAISNIAHNKFGLFYLLFLTFFMLINIAESTLLERNSIFWILYVITTIHLAQVGKTKDTQEINENSTSS